MTAVTAPAPPDASLPPLPWRRMAWVTWRQHRLTLAGVAVLLGAPSVYLLLKGLQMHDAYASVTACVPLRSPACRQVAERFSASYAHPAVLIAGLLQLVPALIGAFVGAPVLAREFESGTFRYAWTQGFGRARWTIAKLVPLAVAVTAAAGAFSLLFSWFYEPVIANGGDSDTSSLAPTIFDLRGVAFAAWVLLACAIGALAGALIRRMLPAMFATFAVWAVLAFVTGALLRPHYEAPLVTSYPDFRPAAFVINQWWTRGGKPATLSMLNQTLRPVGIEALTPEVFGPSPSTSPNVGDPIQYLNHHGYKQLTSYQPASRFWRFQAIEGSWLLLLSVLLIGTTVSLVHRRAT